MPSSNGLSTCWRPSPCRQNNCTPVCRKSLVIRGLLPIRPRNFSLTVYGIEGADFGMGEGLTPAVAAAVEEVAEGVVGEMIDR